MKVLKEFDLNGKSYWRDKNFNPDGVSEWILNDLMKRGYLAEIKPKETTKEDGNIKRN